jgi:sporulation protein YlmC with PRC-barrel domain
MAKPDKIFASELLERELMDLREGTVVGNVADFCVTREGQVTLIGILPEEWYRGGQGVAPAQVTHVTAERISIEDGGGLEPFLPDNDTQFSTVYGDNVYGKQVLRQDGELMGVLVDFAFGLADGRITDIAVIGGGEQRELLAIEAVQTIGRNYIVVTLAAAPAVEAGAPGPKPAAAAAAPEAAAVAAWAEPAATYVEALPRAEPLQVEPAIVFAEPTVAEPLPEPAPEPAPVAAPRVEDDPVLAALSPFDRKKVEYLLGRSAHRELRTPGGVMIAERGATLDVAALSALASGGMLNAVFLEATSLKG